MDRVVLKDLSIFAKHGVFAGEAEIGQRFFVDIAMETNLSESVRVMFLSDFAVLAGAFYRPTSRTPRSVSS